MPLCGHCWRGSIHSTGSREGHPDHPDTLPDHALLAKGTSEASTPSPP